MVAPTPWGLTVDFAPSILQWGANWLSAIFIPGPLLCYVVLVSSWGGFIISSSHSPRHRGGSSFSSSSIGIMKGKAGLSYRPPVLGGSASTAIPPSVTHEVQNVSSLAATPLTNVRVLPLTVNSHPSLLGSSRDVSGGVTPPPLLPLGLILQCLLPPPICSRSA